MKNLLEKVRTHESEALALDSKMKEFQEKELSIMKIVADLVNNRLADKSYFVYISLDKDDLNVLDQAYSIFIKNKENNKKGFVDDIYLTELELKTEEDIESIVEIVTKECESMFEYLKKYDEM